MALIQDYPSLTQSIMAFAQRQDIQIYLDQFIQGAQENLQNDLFELNFGNGIRFQETAFAPVAIGVTGTVPVPTDWLSPKVMTVSDGSSNQFTLIFKPVAWIYDQYPVRQASGLPAYIARDGGNVFVFGPFPDSAYTVSGTYYQQAGQLSDQSPTNWMVLNCPFTLQAACLVEAGKFLPDDEMVGRWTQVYQSRLLSLVNADKAERFAASTMQIEAA